MGAGVGRWLAARMRSNRRRGATLIAFAIAGLGLVAVPSVALGGAQSDLDAALERVVGDELGPPGVSALVQRGDRVSFHRAGVADVRTGRAIHRTDHFRIASTAKAFSGGVAFSLVEDGLVGLDDTVGELLPGRYPSFSEVTVAQLLHHTSGVPTYTSDPEFQERFSSDPRGYISPEEIVGFVADDPLRFPPGSDYYYSNTDNILIGLIGQELTGKVYPNLLRQRVYRPLHLRQTSLPAGYELPLRFVHGYDVAAGAPPEDVSTALSASGIWASGGIVSTPVEMNRFIRGYVGRDLFGRSTQRLQFDFIDGGESQPKGPGDNAAGLAVFRYRTECGTVFGHTGNIPGYTQFMASTKDGRRSVVVSANEQLSAEAKPDVLELLRAADEAAVCAALAGRD